MQSFCEWLAANSTFICGTISSAGWMLQMLQVRAVQNHMLLLLRTREQIVSDMNEKQANSKNERDAYRVRHMYTYSRPPQTVT